MIFRFGASILSTIGKPFYFLLSRTLISLLFIVYTAGHFIVWLYQYSRLAARQFNTLVRKVNNLKLPALRIKLPTIKLKLRKNKKRKVSIKKDLQIIHIFKNSFRLNIPTFKIKKRYIFPPFFLAFIFLAFYFFILKDLPSPQNLITRQQEVSTKIYDRNGILLYTIYKDKNRTIVDLEDVPQHVRLATLASEDAEFYSHPGFSLRGMFRALSKNIREGKLEGGSTITQQLVKNALLSSEKTYIRKLREIILSIKVEMNFSKDEILQMYLNEVSYGGTAYGIQEAAQFYFGKDVNQLNVSEAALLAGLPQSPTRYSPFGPNPELAFSKQREVLHLMRVNRFITDDEENLALSNHITFAPHKTTMLAPHFVMYVRQQLVETYGEEVVEKGGLSVVTTLDYNIQKLAEQVVAEEVNKLKNLQVGNGAAVVLNPKNGDILAMVGSTDYFDVKNDGNVNVAIRPRQPGSSIKIINYAYALSNGLTLSSTVDDSPITFNIPGSIPYSPKNYDGKYRGKITLRSALAESRNIPAVKILASYGVDKMIDLGRRMGITTWEDSSRFGLSLTLGAGEVKLLDLAQVYATVANNGIKPDIKTVKEVRNYKNKILYTQNRFEVKKPEYIIDQRVAYLLIDVLKDNISRSPAFGSNSMLVIPDHPEVAVKTGTSNDLRDNLTIGFNQNYLTAVWVGNNDNSQMSRVASGITGASPIWNKIMRALLSNSVSIEWNIPTGLVKSECFSRFEWYLEEKIQTCPKIIEPAASISDGEIFVEQVRRKDKKRSSESNEDITGVGENSQN